MTTQTISKQRISGAMKKRDRPEWIEPCACAFCGPEKKVKLGIRIVVFQSSSSVLAMAWTSGSPPVSGTATRASVNRILSPD